MANNIHKDILPVNDEWMIRMMENKLSKEEEDMLSADTDDKELFADAVEGLEQFSSVHAAQKQVRDINRQLSEQLKNRPARKPHQPVSLSFVVWIALIFILILAILGYYLVKIKGL